MFKMATCADCNAIAPGTFAGELNRCPTKAEIVATGLLLVSGNYADNQLVNLADITANFQLSITPVTQVVAMAGGSFNLNITSNTAWKITYPAWCSVSAASGTGNASVRVTVAANTSGSRSGSIVVTTSGPANNVSQTLQIRQSGRPTINIGAYGIDVNNRTMQVSASAAVLDDLSIFVTIYNDSSLVTGNGRGTLRKGTRSVLISISGPMNNVSRGYITSVNGSHQSPYETDNAIYTFTTGGS